MAFPSPPSPDLQPFSTQGPAYSDPLQTLAEMQHLRTQGMQQQVAGLGLQQARLKMDSQQAMLDAFKQGGGDPAKTHEIMRTSGKVLPEDLLTYQTHQTKLETEAATLGELERKNLATDLDRYRGMLANAKTVDELPLINTMADKLGISKKIPRLTGAGDMDLVQAFSNSLATHAQVIKEASEKATREKEEAQTKLAGVQTTEAQQKVTAATTVQLLGDVRRAQQDPQTLTPTPAAWKAIRTNPAYAGLNLPAQPTKAYIDQLEESTIAQKDIPEYRIKQAEANALSGMKDQDWQGYIDRVVEDHKSPLYRRTTELVDLYRRQGKFKAADDAVKAAGEQLGKTESAVATAKATEPIKINLAAATMGARADAAGLTEDDYSRAGEQYMRTGVMPAVGRDSITRGRIVKYGNQWARDNGLSPSDVITMQAAYAGDRNSLKQFQAQRDQIVSFEQTAQKNLDMMVTLGKKLTDSGSKWLNKPLRSLNRNLLSTDEQAAFDAAQLIARNEVAKVTSGGGLGGVVSDSARREMEEAMGKDPTISNMIAVANILKQDMANRHGSMDATLSDIKSRIGGAGTPAATGGQQPSGAPASPAAAPKGPAGTVPLKVNHQGKVSTVWLTPTEAARFTREHPDIVVK